MMHWAGWLYFVATGAIATATLLGLSSWARHVGTRSTPASEKPDRARLTLKLLPLATLQIACAWTVFGAAGALFNVVCSWMLMGWLFVLVLNARPVRTLLICRWLGGIGLIACLCICLTIMRM